MIRSMTGYGQGTAETSALRIKVEVRSLNNRFADVRLRLPQELNPLEAELRRKVLSRIRRGRLELDLKVERVGEPPGAAALNRPLAEAVLSAARALRQDLGVKGEIDVKTLLTVPGLLQPATAATALEASELEAVGRALEGALESFDTERRREGASLSREMVSRFDGMLRLLDGVRSRAATVPEQARRRLLDRVANLASGVEIDPTRLAQEVAFLADRADVTEELVRLEGHLTQAKRLLDEPDGEAVGKRLDFLVQEMQREANTIGSKSPDLDLSRLALDLKVEIEKVREQVQNLE